MILSYFFYIKVLSMSILENFPRNKDCQKKLHSIKYAQLKKILISQMERFCTQSQNTFLYHFVPVIRKKVMTKSLRPFFLMFLD